MSIESGVAENRAVAPGPDMAARDRPSALREVLLYALLYTAADSALNRVAFSDGWTILWPLNGITVALLLMRPRRRWPAMLMGVSLGTGVGEWMDGNAPLFEAAQRVISLCEVLLSAWLLPPLSTLEDWLRQPHLFRRFLAALLLGPGVAGLLAALLFHRVQGQPYLLAFNNWATADALGMAATMPLALACRSPELWALLDKAQLARTLGVLALTLCVAGVIFWETSFPLLFLLFPLMLLTESSLGFGGAAIVLFATPIVGVYLSIHGHGPFGHWPPGAPLPRDIGLQIYLGFNLVIVLPASILSLERRRTARELIETNRQLEALASIDGLTGLANRRALDKAFLAEWQRATRLQLPLSLLMIDLDCFKQFNDRYGHHAGDGCLKAVAEALRGSLLRSQDLPARFGGEEFAVLLPHTPLAGAMDVAEKIRAAVEQLGIRHEGNPWGHVTISVGCCSAVPCVGDDRIALLETADAALYAAKHGGRNGCQAREMQSGLPPSKTSAPAPVASRIEGDPRPAR